MPLFKQGEGNAPAWSELEAFFLVYADPREKNEFTWRGPKERYIGIEGAAKIICGDKTFYIKRGQVFDPPAADKIILTAEEGRAGICRCCGNWGGELGGSGIFAVAFSGNPVNAGDQTDYPRNATFDNHYHDCDEYWIIFEGCGVAYSEGILYEAGVGDCIATGRGYHHDFPIVREPIWGAYFETTLTGQKRLGHLWTHTHGAPSPDPARK